MNGISCCLGFIIKVFSIWEEQKNGKHGFLGREILSQLLTTGVSVTATDLGVASVTAGIVYLKAEITRPEELKPVLENSTRTGFYSPV